MSRSVSSSLCVWLSFSFSFSVSFSFSLSLSLFFYLYVICLCYSILYELCSSLSLIFSPFYLLHLHQPGWVNACLQLVRHLMISWEPSKVARCKGVTPWQDRATQHGKDMLNLLQQCAWRWCCASAQKPWHAMKCYDNGLAIAKFWWSPLLEQKLHQVWMLSLSEAGIWLWPILIHPDPGLDCLGEKRHRVLDSNRGGTEDIRCSESCSHRCNWHWDTLVLHLSQDAASLRTEIGPTRNGTNTKI